MNPFLQHGENSFRHPGMRLALIGSLLCVFVLATGCEKTPVKPVDITTNDLCFHCKAPISEIAFAAEFITKDGFVRKFDDMACMLEHARKIGKKNILGFYAIDAQTRKLYPVEEVQFVRSDKIRTPHNGGIVAYKDPAKADDIAARFKAEKVTLDDLMK